ncbi:hypothetical protein ACSC1U_09640 [Mammaliicoccus lentus]
MILNDFGNIAETLDSIIAEHEELSTQTWSLKYVSNTISSKINDTIGEVLKNSLLGINNADRNTQILIELIQGYMQSENINNIFNTEDNEPDFVENVSNLINRRISKMKQRKNSK